MINTEATINFKVKTVVYEGPLDLLLNLIEKRKLFINEISLSKVTDDYLEYLKQMQNFPLGDAANFVLIASTLVLIKSRSLLPNLSLTEEEEGSIEDLETRLKIYKVIKEAGVAIRQNFGKKIIFGKLNSKFIEPIFSPDKNTTLESVARAMGNVLNSLPKTEKIQNTSVKKIISLEEVINNLTHRVKSCLKMSFREFSGLGKKEKVEVIVSFLAMLELVKNGIIRTNQNKTFDDIEIETQEIGIPSYN